MKPKFIITLIIILILLTIALIFFYSEQESEESEDSLTNKEIIQRISDGYADGISKSELEELLNQELGEKTVITGEDSYLNEKPEQSIIETYNLEEYETLQTTYVANVEEQIKNNYTWEFIVEAEDMDQEFFIEIQTYNFGIYLYDLDELINLLLENVTYEDSEEQTVYEYKAKIIAMKLLDSHLTDYINEEETKTIYIDFTNLDNDETKNSLSQYLLDLAGYNYHNISSINEMNENRTERLSEYINDAIADGTLNEEDILQI